MARKTATVDARPEVEVGQLPSGTGLFVGRRAELAALAAGRGAVVAGRCPVLVVAGRPGSGRTALAVRFAASVAAEYPDGTAFARLSAADGSRVPPARAARSLLEQLGVEPPAALPEGTETAGGDDPVCRALLEAVAGRRVLLVLDDVRDAGQLWPLLAVAPQALVVATTAGPLTGIEGIDPVILGGLELRSSIELLSALAGGTRVAADPVATAGLAEACAARPTALRLMAGWLRAAPKAAVTEATKALTEAANAGLTDLTAEGRRRAKEGGPVPARPTGTPQGVGPSAPEQPGGEPAEPPDGRAGRRADGKRAFGPAGSDARTADAQEPRGQKDSGRKNRVQKDGTQKDGAQKDGARTHKGPEPQGPQREAPRTERPPLDRDAAEPVPVPDGDPLDAAFLLLYRALPAPQARMLRMLTLAPAQQADLRTASALLGCPAPEAATVLQKLTDRELLEQEPPSADGTPRYRVPGRFLPRLVRMREELDRPSEVQLARARLLERLVRLVESARALLDPGGGPGPEPLPGPLRLRTAAHARQWLAEERERLLAAVADAIGQADLDGSAGRLVTALLRTLPLTGRAAPAELYQLHELVLRVAERGGSPRRAAAALLNLADLQAAAGHWETGARRYQQALGLARTSGDELACARALEGVAESRRALGDPVRAADWYGRALALRRGLGDQRAEARLLARVAEAHLAQRRYEEAEREYRAALAVLRRLADERGLRAVGAALERLRELVEAERVLPSSE
ncbi:AAA family ATPase [Kitasatospora sp. NPDC096147]|uniref:AAA family ATPase n=1 Tax=Kitasatospora sp. NPDC096147 TaxID=3364093 RepID=UPI00381F72F0